MAEPNRAREVAEQVTAEPRYHSDIEIDPAEAYLAAMARVERLEGALREFTASGIEYTVASKYHVMQVPIEALEEARAALKEEA